jgi:hypothetical protein
MRNEEWNEEQGIPNLKRRWSGNRTSNRTSYSTDSMKSSFLRSSSVIGATASQIE